MAEKPRKLSELDQIENISGDDLLLVSDYDGGACASKKMTMAQIASYICAAVAQDPSVAEAIRQAAERAAEQAVSVGLEPAIMQTIEKNIGDIADLVADGDKDGTMTIDGNNF